MSNESDAERRRFSSESSEQDMSEDALRQALARLGSGNHRAGASSNGQRHVPDNRRRRFVQDGEVLVEHHTSRQSARVMTAPSEDHEEIERLKNLVKMEQRRYEDSQRQCHDAQNQLRSMETRVAHADLRVKELQGFLQERDARIMALMTQITAQPAAPPVTQAANQDDMPLRPRQPGRPRIHAVSPSKPRLKTAETASVEPENEPEPVKWWIKA